ncbi:putative basic amino acid antiporter YfcC [Thalassotalea aquiviva]|uniref:putative basic amino acid antiporter YfcC n=1 Tax=Thalassotalea aquiviva TaxID=3242415 RepID=UPI00352BA606
MTTTTYTSSVSSSKRMPDAFIILFFVVVFAAVLTHLVPAGKFSLSAATPTQEATLIADSFTLNDTSQGVPLFAEQGGVGFFNFAFEGMVSGSKWGSAIGVMMFILITGGAFGVVMKTGAINNGILALIYRVKKAETLFIPILFILFSLAGAVFGMGEEAIAFCIVLLPLMRALGYDNITTVMVTYVATQIGFATSWMNPFSVAIAQGIADVPLLSGAEFRMVCWLVFTVFGTVFTMRYAHSIKAEKQQSGELGQSTMPSFQLIDGVVLLAFLATIIWVIWGVTARGYYIPELASQFFTMACVIGVISVIGKRLDIHQVSDAFQQGAKDLLPAALIVGMAKGIVILLGGDNPAEFSVLNTILYGASEAIGDLPKQLSALCMLLFQSVFNFFIASGSGQAALTMPLMAPLSDLIGISRQVAVLAFQLGDGLTNIIIPTSASLIGCLGVAKIDWLVWAKFVYKFLLALILLSATTMVVAVSIQFS